MEHIVKLPCELQVSRGECYVANCLSTELMDALPDESVDAVYADLPFRTGLTQRDPRDPNLHYDDSLSEKKWLDRVGAPFAVAARRVLKPHGSCYVHLDWRMVWRMKTDVMDDLWGQDNFLGDIIWATDWGARQKDRFAKKHDTILHYVKDSACHRFDPEKVDRVPYKAPELQMYRAKRLGKDDGAARIAAGKPVTDVFTDINIVGTSSNERALNSYPTMKPVKLIKRLLAPVVVPGSVVLDPFCGSGTTAQAAYELDCSFVTGDANPKATLITARRAERLGAKFAVVEC